MNLEQTKWKYLKLLYPFVLFPCLALIYMPVNSMVILPLLKCGCPYENAAGDLVTRYFSANHFTLVYFVLLSLLSVGVALYVNKFIYRRGFKILYCLFVGIAVVAMFIYFYPMLLWR